MAGSESVETALELGPINKQAPRMATPKGTEEAPSLFHGGTPEPLNGRDS